MSRSTISTFNGALSLSPSGGVAEVTLGANAVDFDILDWDILKMADPGDFNRDYLSPRAQRYIKAQDPELFARLYPERSR